MMTNRLTRRGSSGSRITASAIFVNGPTAHRMRRPECERAAAMIESAACSASDEFLRLRQNRMAKAGRAVNFTRVPHRDGDRGRRARPDGNIRSPGKRENRARVARRGRERNVADDRGDAEDVRLVMRAGVEQRERIVDAGVDVEDEGLGELGHEVNLLLGHAPAHPSDATRHCGRARDPRSNRKSPALLADPAQQQKDGDDGEPGRKPDPYADRAERSKKPNARPTGAPIAQ